MKAITRKEQFYDAIINGTETPTPLTREDGEITVQVKGDA